MASRVHAVLLSPRVGELVDDDMARYLSSQLAALQARPAEEVSLRRGTVKAWGVELTSEDEQRAYRVAFVVEADEEEPGAEVLTICALEEKTQLEAPVARRKKLKGWRMVAVDE